MIYLAIVVVKKEEQVVETQIYKRDWKTEEPCSHVIIFITTQPTLTMLVNSDKKVHVNFRTQVKNSSTANL